MPEDYLIGEIKKTLVTDSLFFNNLEKIQRTADERFVHQSENKRSKNKFKRDVEYSYNSLGFRSDEFKIHHDKEHILFAGCSETEGVGGNLDSCWSHMLYSELLKEKELSGFFNLGRAGWGYDRIISNIMSYISIYGKPDKLFMLFPNLGRFYGWDKNESKYLETFVYKYSLPPNTETEKKSMYPESIKEMHTEEQRQNFISFTLLVKMFEEYCLSSGIKLFWSTWNNFDAKNIERVGIFKNYFSIDGNIFYLENQEYLLEMSKEREDWGSKRDGHSGYLLHFTWFSRFLSQLKLDQTSV